MSNNRCIAVLGGSFDPVHNGHVALAKYFLALLQPDELRIIPAGNPWQKPELQTAALHRIAMARAAFDEIDTPVVIDEQEVERTGPSYTVDTLRALREELGPATSIVFLLGADQMQRLHTWHDWRALFDHAHLCAATRPGFDMDGIAQEVAGEFTRRSASPGQLRASPCGLTCIARDLSVDIAATELRAALQRGERPVSQLPAAVLDYIEQHHLYRS
jgi:nicotinate-nucleotide adenylyltransferase